MFKYLTVICVMAAVCAGAPQQSQNPQDVQILRFDSDVQPDGYSFAYETSDGTSRQEEGKLDNPQSENAALTVTGQYAYVAPDGKKYTVTFTAGPNGFQPKTSLGHYETSDGTSRQEEGKLDNPQSENAALTVTGQYAYVAPDGKKYTVTFTAGPNGFQPKTSLGQ